MFKRSLVVLAVAMIAPLAGCQAGAEFKPFAGRQDPAERTQMAAYAASVRYPREAQASDDLRAAALVNRQENTIRILNFSDQSLRDATVWINGAFVHRVDVIPPNGSVIIPRRDFYDATGRSLADQASTATRVQIQTGDTLYNLQGPVYE